MRVEAPSTHELWAWMPQEVIPQFDVSLLLKNVSQSVNGEDGSTFRSDAPAEYVSDVVGKVPENDVSTLEHVV